jgi:hypothetical protein
MTKRTTTKRYICGPYAFFASLPQYGHSNDQEEWTASIGGKELPARYRTLEDAMRAALSSSPTPGTKT